MTWPRVTLPLLVLVFLGLLAHRYGAPFLLREEQHGDAAHGGVLVPVGGGRYHCEAVFTRDGFLKLYTLAADPGGLQEVESQRLTAHVWADGETEARTVPLEPEPQEGDAAGKTSRFAGRLPDGLEGRALHVSIPNLRIGGGRFRVAFARPGDTHLPEMPRKVTDAEERELYLVPGGKYTQRDIAANGGLTASQRYRGFRASHDANPRPGDRICPVTETRANPACTWTIDGHSYAFCCPPCIDEFVRLAKEQPERLREPEAYTKRPD